MKSIYLFSYLCTLAFQAFAQDGVITQAVPQVATDPVAQREQRRMELRTALKQQHQVPAPSDPRKQFSQQERSALRQQVRQQQDVAKHQP